MSDLQTETRSLLALIEQTVPGAKNRSLLRLKVLRLYAVATERGLDGAADRPTLPCPAPIVDTKLVGELAASLHAMEVERRRTGT